MILLEDLTLSIGIESVGGVMSVLNTRNKKIPIAKTERFTTHFDNQASVPIQIFEGER